MADQSPRLRGSRPTLPPRVMAAFGTDIKNLRTVLGLPVTEVARRAGITRAAIDQYERGESCPTLAALVGLARAYGVSVARLVAAFDATAKNR